MRDTTGCAGLLLARLVRVSREGGEQANRGALETELDRFNDELQGLIKILQNGNGDDIRTWLEDAANDRNQILKLNAFLKR